MADVFEVSVLVLAEIQDYVTFILEHPLAFRFGGCAVMEAHFKASAIALAKLREILSGIFALNAGRSMDGGTFCLP